MSSNNLSIMAAAAAAAASSSLSPSCLLAASSTSSSLLPGSTSTSSPKLLVLPPKLTASISPLQWNGTDYLVDGITRKDIHAHDVLSGRGGASNNHPGNEAFRQLVNKVKFDYLQCPKREKPLLAMRIVQAVRAQSPPGRFLQHDKLTDTWKDVGDTKAREKTSQALREGAPIIRDLVHKPSPSNLPNVLKQVKKEDRKNEPTKKSDYVVSLPSTHSSGIPPSGLSPLSVETASKPDPSCLTFPNHPQMEEHRHPASTLSIEATRPNFYPQYSVESRRIVSGDFSAAARNELPPVPFEIVRGLLLGHIDPVTVATSILSREEAAIVAYRHHLNARPTRMLPTAAQTEIIHGKKHLLEGPASGEPMVRDQTTSIESLELARIPSTSSTDHSEPKERTIKSPKQQTSQRRAPLKKRRLIVDA
mmetsp:Transcript_5494/g.7686  ORF Transcript_5494/g.7686 Transcript_5494/m.7686 type:complete len:420 (+) Transcript_5494:60-1319(+)